MPDCGARQALTLAQPVSDPGHVRQVLLNLVGNAVKFTDQGRVRVDVDVAAGAPEDARSRLRFTVTDTGIGIPAAMRGRLFEAFAPCAGKKKGER